MIVRALAGGVTGLVAGGTLAVALMTLAPANAPGPVVADAPTVQQTGTPGAAPVLEQPAPTVTATPDVPGGDDAPRRTLSDQPGEPAPDVQPAPDPVQAAPQVAEAEPPKAPDAPRSPGADAPVLPSPLALSPSAPAGEQDVVLGAAPVAPSQVPVAQVPASPEPASPEPVQPAALGAPAGSVAPDGAATAGDPPTASGSHSPTPPQDAPAVEPPSDVPPLQLATPDTAVPESDMAPAALGAPATGLSPIAQGAVPLTPVVTTGAERVAAGAGPVRVNRPGVAAAEDNASALVRYGDPIQITGELPLMSIILLQDAIDTIPVKTLDDLPMAVTIAVPTGDSTATAKMRRYRDAGFEVLAVADLPSGATPEDMAVSLEASFAAVPEAVGLLDAGAVALGSDRSVIASAVARLKADGRGLVTLSSGLNMAEREALRQDVPVAVIYRDMDGEGQAKRTIRRFLEQASFRARQQGSVVLLARLKTNTIEALLDWWGRPDSDPVVQVIPVSALLRAQVTGQITDQ